MHTPTGARTGAHTYMRARMRTHAYARTHARTHAHHHTRTRAHAHAHTGTQAHTQAHTRTRTHTHAQARTHTQIRARALLRHTHTHTHSSTIHANLGIRSCCRDFAGTAGIAGILRRSPSPARESGPQGHTHYIIIYSYIQFYICNPYKTLQSLQIPCNPCMAFG